MIKIIRRSPIKFDDHQVAEIKEFNGFQVAQAYLGQSKGPLLIDLSHLPSWDIQDNDLTRFQDMGLKIPSELNGVSRQGALFISRLNQTQCQVWSLDGEPPEFDTKNRHCTEVTDGQAVMGLMGNRLESVVETFTTLDMFKPGTTAMRLYQAPLFHIPCQILVLDRSSDGQVILISCPRGYGNDMAQAILTSGGGLDLHPGGVNVFLNWLTETN